MILRIVAAVLSSVFLLSGVGYLIWGIHKRKSSPSLGSRIIFCGMGLLSLLTFLVDGNRDLIGAIVILADIVGTALIGIAVVWRDGFKFSLGQHEIYYIWAAVAVMIIWFITKNAFLAFMLTQLIVIIGYAPVVHKMFVFKRNTESTPAWLLFLISFILGSYPAYLAWQHGEVLSLVYAARGVVFIGIVISIGLYYEMKNKNAIN